MSKKITNKEAIRLQAGGFSIDRFMGGLIDIRPDGIIVYANGQNYFMTLLEYAQLHKQLKDILALFFSSCEV